MTEARQRLGRGGIPPGATRWLVSLPPIIFLIIFFLVPTLSMLLASFQQPGEFGGLLPLWAAGRPDISLETYRFIFSDFIYAEIFLRSFLAAALTTLCCLVLAYPLALLMARGGQRWRNLLVMLAVLPFASNFLIRIYAWIILLGPLDLLYSPWAVLAGLVHVQLPFMILPLYANLETHDPAWLEAAQDLGAGAWTRFWRITLPLSLPGVWSGGALVFIPVLGMFAVPELLGGTGDILIGNLIKAAFLDDRDWPLGATLSMLLALFVLLIVALSARLGQRRGSA